MTSSFARQIAEIEAGLREPVLHVGNLESRRDITDVRDTVRAYRLIVERGTPRRPYNVCCGHAHRIADLLQLLVRAIARRDPRADGSRPAAPERHAGRARGSFARLAADTGWEPRIPIERTLADLLDHWRRVTATAARRVHEPVRGAL